MDVEECNIAEPLVVNEVVMEDVSNVSRSVGRPVIDYENASYRTKKRRSDQLAENYCSPELGQALKKRKTCHINNNELNPNDMKSYMKMSSVLAMYLDLRFTAAGYQKFKNHNKAITGYDLYPSYKNIVVAKRESFPPEIYVTDEGASVHLFSLLENTVKKIILLQNKEEWIQLSKTNLHLVGK